MKLERVYPLCEMFEEDRNIVIPQQANPQNTVAQPQKTSVPAVAHQKHTDNAPDGTAHYDVNINNHLFNFDDYDQDEATDALYSEIAGLFKTPVQHIEYKKPDFTAWYNDYWAKQEAQKQQDLNRNQGKRLGADLGNFLRAITDHIQSASGAPVLPSNVQEQYDKLDAEHKAIYDTYWARQDAMRQQQHNDEMVAQQMQQQADSLNMQADNARQSKIAELAEKIKQQKIWAIVQTYGVDQRTAENIFNRNMAVKNASHKYILPDGSVITLPPNGDETLVSGCFELINEKVSAGLLGGLKKEMEGIKWQLASPSAKLSILLSCVYQLPTQKPEGGGEFLSLADKQELTQEIVELMQRAYGDDAVYTPAQRKTTDDTDNTEKDQEEGAYN